MKSLILSVPTLRNTLKFTRVPYLKVWVAMGGAASVAVEIYGYDFQTTDQIANELRDKMLNNPAFAQVTLSRDQYTPEYQVDFDRVKLAANGLNSTSAAAAVSAAMSGTVGSYYREDGEEYDIRVRYSPRVPDLSVSDIENIIIYNGAGNGIRIKDLGTVIETEVPPTIERKNRQRMITVTGIIDGSHAMSDGVTAASQIIKDTDIPSELDVVIAGDYEDQKDMFADLITLMVLIIILVYMVMASQFESFMSPFVIMFSVPFAFVARSWFVAHEHCTRCDGDDRYSDSYRYRSEERYCADRLPHPSPRERHGYSRCRCSCRT